MTLYNGAVLKMVHEDGTPYTYEKDGVEHTFKVISHGTLWDGNKHKRIVELELIQ